jgi:hypothetical protein
MLNISGYETGLHSNRCDGTEVERVEHHTHGLAQPKHSPQCTLLKSAHADGEIAAPHAVTHLREVLNTEHNVRFS